MAKYLKVGNLDGIPIGGKRALRAGGKELLLVRVGQREVYCVENRCTHADAPLEKGELEGTRIECPRHGARFDIRTGAVLRMPAAVPLRTFPVRILKGGEVEVDLEEED